MKVFCLLILSCISLQLAMAQEYPDRHNTSLESSWMSCQATQSPNPIRAVSHWIMYDFGTTYALNKSTFWNVNAYGHTDEGTNDMKIDYSMDGINWLPWGRYSLAQAAGTSIYEGESGPDFNGLVTRYLLITSETNYGGTCHGLGEFRVQSSPVTISDTKETVLNSNIIVSPNPFNTATKITFEDFNNTLNNQYQLIDMLGRVVRQNKISSSEFYIDGTGLSTGSYTLLIRNEKVNSSIQINFIN